MSKTSNHNIDTLNDFKVETVKFSNLINDPLKTERKRQLKKKLNQWCRHRQTETSDILISGLDQTITVERCSECGKYL